MNVNYFCSGPTIVDPIFLQPRKNTENTYIQQEHNQKEQTYKLSAAKVHLVKDHDMLHKEHKERPDGLWNGGRARCF